MSDLPPHLLTAWADAALADGWTEKPGGPWGVQADPLTLDEVHGGYIHTGARRDGDKSRQFDKDGVRVWLVDRSDFPDGGRLAYLAGWVNNVAVDVPVVYTTGWAVHATRRPTGLR